MTEKNKELGAYSAIRLLENELKNQEDWYERWKTTTEKGSSMPGKELQINELKEGIKLIQQSGEKPEIDKKYMKKKAEAMHFYMGLPAGVCLPICEEFVSEIISEVQKPEIDEEWLEMKAKMFTALAYKLTQHEPHIENHHFNKLQAKDFIRQIVAEVRKVKTIQVGEVLFGKEEHEKQMARVRDDLLDGIIDTVLEHADCHHTVDHDEDGTHCSSEYDIDSEEKVKEKLRKILNKGGD